jgi:hypothetical protein
VVTDSTDPAMADVLLIESAMGSTSDAYAAHNARYYGPTAEVKAAGLAWYDVLNRKDISPRDRRRLQARYMSIIRGSSSTPSEARQTNDEYPS